MTSKARAAAALAAIISMAGSAPLLADSIIIVAARDTTIGFDSILALESSSGGSPSLFTGRNNTGWQTNRALLAFDLSGVPAGATVTEATLTLLMDRAAPTNMDVTVGVHRVGAVWGEGMAAGSGGGGGGSPPEVGAASWTSRIFPTDAWALPGGDFAPAASASQVITSTPGYFSWSGPGLVQDVQGWRATPASNNGWLLRGDESASGTARRYFSREAENPAYRPTLTLTYTTQPVCVADFNSVGGVTVQDVFDFLAAWFGGDPRANINLTGGITVQDIFDYLGLWFAGC